MNQSKFPPGKAFHLKREGKFEAALIAYAHEYLLSQRENDAFLREVCLDQMVDICLLDYLTKRPQEFSSKDQLKIEVLGRLREQLGRQAHSEEFESDFERSWTKFSRGVGPHTRPFSVDPRQLVRPRQRRQAETP